MRVLVLGATGYIGGRLVPELLAASHQVRCAVRSPAKLDARPWRDHVEVCRGDVTDADSMRLACEGVDAVVFLVHAMDGGADFETTERRGAQTVAAAAAATGVRRIVYLGGLGDEDDQLSTHLRSRQAVGAALASGSVPVTELRAGMIIGSGSASFEMLRNLVEMLPAMITPRWVDTRTQPIAVRDVLRYLVGVLGEDATAGQILEIGGPDVVTYRQMMQLYTEVAGLRQRVIVGVPVLTPRLSSLWVGLVTPLPTGLARPLIDSLVNEVVVRDDRIRRLVPFDPLPLDQAIRLALQRIQDLEVASTWASAGRAGAAAPLPQDPGWAGGTVLSDVRRVRTTATPAQLFATVTAIGGASGWYSSRLLWGVRGTLDKLIGGAGLRRGRRHPSELAVGDAVYLCRVEALEPPRLVRLRAEMKLPGDAWLEFRIAAAEHGSVLEQRARFHPRGLWGRAYWYALVPFHWLIFPRMARRLTRAAVARRS